MNIHTRWQDKSGNWLLSGTSPACQEFLAAHMVSRQVEAGTTLHDTNAPLHSVIFPHDALISLQATLHDGRSVETVPVGRDGCIGFEYLFGARVFPSQAMTVLSGRLSMLPASILEQAAQAFPCLRQQLFTYAWQVSQHMMQTIACASHHSASQRLATWLLHAHDRTNRDSFHLTQRTLAHIFGVRLATINDACARLQSANAIEHSRGVIQIADHDALARQACECYQSLRGTDPARSAFNFSQLTGIASS